MLMTVTCPTCRAAYKLDPARIPAGGGLITCKNCQTKVTVKPPPAEPEEIEQLSEADEVVENEEPTLKTMKVRRDSLGLPPALPPPPPPQSPPSSGSPGAAAAAPSAPAEAMPVAPGASLYECPHCHKPFYLKEARKSGAVTGAPDPAPRAAPPPADGRKTVLVVDDQEFFRTFARDLLSPRYRILEADSTALALELIPGADLVVLDLTLTGEDGRAVLRCKPAGTRCLIFSGQEEMADDPALFRELQALGADDLLMKSIAAGDELKRKVAVLLGDAPVEARPRLD